MMSRKFLKSYQFRLFLLGFITFSTQIILIEEIYSMVWKNEFIFAFAIFSWMFATALGGILERKFNITLDVTFIIILMFFPLLSYVPVIYRVLSHSFLRILTPLEIFILTILILSPSGFLTGLSFVSAIKETKNSAEVIAIGYLFEAVGSATGALLVFILSIVLVPGKMELFIIVAFASIILLFSRKIFIFNLIFSILLLITFPKINHELWYLLTDGIVKAEIKGHFSELTLVEKNHEDTIYSGYFPLYAFPDPSAETQIKAPLFILNKITSNVFLVTEDGPNLVGTKWHPLLSREEPELKKIEEKSNLPLYPLALYGDPLVTLRKENKLFSVIAINAELPSTIKDERFFTKRFFSIAKKHLKSNGLLIFDIGKTENYPSFSLKKGISWIIGRGQSLFRTGYIIPLEHIYIVFSQERTQLKNFCRSRILTFKTNPSFYNLIGECNQSLINFYSSIIAEKPPQFPFIYLAGISKWWEETEGRPLKNLLNKNTYYYLIVIIILFLISVIIKFKDSPFLNYFISGFIGLTGEVILIYLFQATFGVVFLHLSMIMGIFMLSLALGSYLSTQQKFSLLFKFLIPIFATICIFSDLLLLFYIGVILFGTLIGYSFGSGSIKRSRQLSNSNLVASEAEFLDHISGALGSIVAPILITAIGLTTGMIIVILLVVAVILLKSL